ncbi:MAG: ABC transporter ATP-binding protein [Candidatus Omnitrophica bacterium]|nr:ABC transporter ATP-binding protein [Candidatus Omnitrophota bacterium]MCM8816004.1 ABC transporter ATP-binding protein [Candidatus Omnitrophota bacterium]
MNNSFKLSALEIVKKYRDIIVLNNVSINVKESQFFALLGPSGSGKTTLLRVIAGFVKPDCGRIFIDSKDITQSPPNKRNMAMVFQNFSLWPHMNVFENIAFGLRIKKLADNIIKEKVNRVLKMVHLEQYASKKPQHLSGGQQQRVALARALVVEPEILLLDEPLSNLDAKLRDELRQEIKTLHKNLGITTVYVTHDQKEAMYLADMVAIMTNGNIAGVDSPERLYRKPSSIEIARFLGEVNEFRGVVKEIKAGVSHIETQIGNIVAITDIDLVEGEKVSVCVRPELIQFPANPASENKIMCQVINREFTGSLINVTLAKNNMIFKAIFTPSSLKSSEVKECLIGIDARDVLIFKV